MSLFSFLKESCSSQAGLIHQLEHSTDPNARMGYGCSFHTPLRCNCCGGPKTYARQAVLPLNGKAVCIDWCIHHIVAALNAAGIHTVACCCGHGTANGRIELEDGRVLEVHNPIPKEPGSRWGASTVRSRFPDK